MKTKLRFLAMTFLLIVSIAVKAGDVNQVGSIWYDIDLSTRTASVVANPSGGKYSGEISIPTYIDFDGSVRVTAIGNNAFQGCVLLTKITLTNQITSIGEYAFSGCTGLKTIDGYAQVTTIGKYAFNNCSQLTEFRIYTTLTYVGLSAFTGCTGLEKVYVYDYETFGEITFDNNNRPETNSSNPLNLTNRMYLYDPTSKEWYAPTTVWADGKVGHVVRNNTYIKMKCHTVIVQDLTTQIGLAAFSGCEMEELLLPQTLTTISKNSFANCKNLKRVSCAATNPPTATAAGSYPPFNGTNVSEATLYVPAASVDAYKAATYWKDFGTITAIPEAVDMKQFGGIIMRLNATGTASVVGFDASELPPNVHIPDFIAYMGTQYPVTSIRDYAFRNCSMSTLDLSTDITCIGSHAFENCQNLVNVFIDKEVKNIGNNPFNGCISLQEVRITAETPPSSLNDWQNINNATLEVPPSSVSTYRSTTPWSGFESITELIGENFWYKGIRYFLKYDGTASVTGFNEAEMDENAVILSTIPVETPYTVTSIADRAFQSGYWENIGNNVWRWIYTGGEKIKKVQIPGTIKTIGESAFEGCKSLQSVVLFSGITSIGESAFRRTGLTTLDIPGSVKTIGDYAFDFCTSLSSLKLNYGIERLGRRAFMYCNLTSVTIPPTVNSIDIYVFYNLTSIKVESGNPYYDSRGNCNAIIRTETDKLICACVNTVIPEDVKVIGFSSFYDVAIEEIVIPNQVTTIENSAIYGNSGLTTIKIGKNVSIIESDNFYFRQDKFKVTDVYCYAKIPPSLGDHVFCTYYGSPTVYTSYAPQVTLHVPASSISLYSNAEVWKDFNIVALPVEGISTEINEAVTQPTTQEQPMYNVAGQRVGKDYKGIVIQNGKKTVVR